MELEPRHAAFLLDEMDAVENDDTRLPSERKEAETIKQKAEAVLTE